MALTHDEGCIPALIVTEDSAGQSSPPSRYLDVRHVSGPWASRAQEIAALVVRRFSWRGGLVSGEIGLEDLMQEVTIKILPIPDRYPYANDAELGRLAYGTGLNFLKDLWRHKTRERRNVVKVAKDVQQESHLVEAIATDEGTMRLHESLDVAHQEVLNLLLIGNHQAEVARILGKSRSSISASVAVIREKALVLGIRP